MSGQLPGGPTRDELVSLCEDAVRPESAWRNRDSEEAHRQLGQAWALLKAGCEFHIGADSDERTLWVYITSKGFEYFEWGDVDALRKDHFYIPTRERLDAVGDGDWYC